jgi:Protein of unknown function (DUF3617)
MANDGSSKYYPFCAKVSITNQQETSMRNTLRTTLCFLLLGPAIAHANGVNIKPGLWVISHQGNMNHHGVNMKMPSPQEMQAMMKNLPPDVQAKIAQHTGENGSAMMTDEGVKVCISPEQAAQNTLPMAPNNSQCKLANQTRHGNTINIKMQCPQGEMESTVTLQSDTAWSSNMKGNMQQNGKNSSMNMQATGKWLNSDCGTLKPFSTATQTTK